MNRFRIPLARPTAVALGLLQAVFLLAAVAPRMVWCHKPDGRIAIEFEAAPGECRCEQCPLCRERESAVRSEGPAPAVSFHAVHCRHDEIRSEAGRDTNLVRGAGGAALGAMPAVIPNASVRPIHRALAPAIDASSSAMDAGPPGGVLRC